MDLIQCRFCKAYLPEQSRFCGYCGNAIGDVSTPTVHTPVPPGLPFQEGNDVVSPNYSTLPASSTPIPAYSSYPAPVYQIPGIPTESNPSNPANGVPPQFYPSSPANGAPPQPYSSSPSNGMPQPPLYPSNPANEEPSNYPTSPLPPRGQPEPPQDVSHVVHDDVFDIENWPYPVGNSQIDPNGYPATRRRGEDEDDDFFPLPLIGNNAPAQAPTPFVHGTPQPMNIPTASGAPHAPQVYHPQPQAHAHPQSWSLQQAHARPQHMTHQQAHPHPQQQPHFQSLKPPKQVAHHLVKPLTYAAVSVAVITALVVVWLKPPSPAASAQISITSAGGAAPGATIHVHGDHFVKGGKIAFTVNGRSVPATDVPRTTAGRDRQFSALLHAGSLVHSDQQRQAEDNAPVVQNDGTFDAVLTIPMDLKPDSNNQYTITASEENTRLSISITVAAVQLVTPQSKPGSTPAQTPTKQPGVTSQATPTPVPPTPKSTPTPVPTPEPTPEPTPKTPPAPKPCVKVSPDSLNFSMQTGGTTSGAQSVTVRNCGNRDSAIAISTDTSWLSAETGSLSLKTGARKDVDIKVSGQGLKAGSYSGVVTFTSGNASAKVRVTLDITQVCKVQQLSPVTFNAQTNQESDPEPYVLPLYNGCSTAQMVTTSISPSTATWLSVKPSSAQIAPGATVNFTISASIKGLKEGTYKAQITFSDGTASSIMDVTLNITKPVEPCSFTVSPGKIVWNIVAGRGPATQTLTVTPTGDCGANDSATVASEPNGSESWLGASPASVPLGKGPQSVNVFMTNNGTGMTGYTYKGSVTISGGKTTVTVPVTLTVTSKCTYTVSPDTLKFTLYASTNTSESFASSTGDRKPSSGQQNITVTPANCGNDAVSVTVSDKWLSANPAPISLGGNPQIITITACVCGLGAGTHSGWVKVGNQSVSVTLIVVADTSVTPTPTPTSTPTPTPVPRKAVPTPTPTPAPTPTPVPKKAAPTPTPVPIPTPTPKVIPTPTPEPEQPTPTPKPKKTPKPEKTPTSSD